jgi:hypothetical protein
MGIRDTARARVLGYSGALIAHTRVTNSAQSSLTPIQGLEGAARCSSAVAGARANKGWSRVEQAGFSQVPSL